TSVFCGLLLFLFISKESVAYSRVVFVVSWSLCVLTAIICRWVLRGIFKRYEFGNVRAIIMGAGTTGVKTARLLGKNKYLGISPIAFLDDDPSMQNSVVENLPVVGYLNKIKATAEKLNVDYIIACLPVTIVMKKIKEHCDGFKHIMIIPADSMFSVVWVYAYDIGGILGLEIRCNLMLKSLLRLKQLFDYSLTLMVTTITVPLMIFCAIIIKLTSKGAIIYKAHRLGVHGKVFFVYKFRTMKLGSEQHFEQYLEDNPEAKKEWKKTFKLKKDPRITWVGNILRRTSLDELPQLFNVLRGEMSLIGPRPIVESEKKHYNGKYEMISSVRPGITGLWQVSGRSELDYEERVELDCYYLMNWNVWLDVFILLKTAKEVLFCKGAY
ncbi:MAG: undecaprenyl-phosphate galactose phosphotransferase WbaP, partial [Victivallaceae bacterium]|nr:undecaprenyl-phosphate galactose phosphotransferase WbaP [Victivallaceae bacterium]